MSETEGKDIARRYEIIVGLFDDQRKTCSERIVVETAYTAEDAITQARNNYSYGGRIMGLKVRPYISLLVAFALLASACGVPNGPTKTQIGRNVDGTPHYLGDPYQPWIPTNVTPLDPTTGTTIKHPPTP